METTLDYRLPWTLEVDSEVDEAFEPGIRYCKILSPNPHYAISHGWDHPHIYRLLAAAPDLLNALQALRLECLSDPLNPCWNNRPTDVPGKHWGVGDACTSCNARAAIAKATGVQS